MSEKKRRERHPHVKYIEKDKNGKYVYKGTWYFFDGSEKERKTKNGKLWALCCAVLCVIVICGFLPVPGMNNTIYLLLPYMVELPAGVYVCWKQGRLMLNKDPLREYVYEDLTEKIPMGAVIVLAAAAILAAGEIVFLILNGAGGRPGYAAAFIVLQAACAASVYGVRRIFKTMHWKEGSKET